MEDLSKLNDKQLTDRLAVGHRIAMKHVRRHESLPADLAAGIKQLEAEHSRRVQDRLDQERATPIEQEIEANQTLPCTEEGCTRSFRGAGQRTAQQLLDYHIQYDHTEKQYVRSSTPTHLGKKTSMEIAREEARHNIQTRGLVDIMKENGMSDEQIAAGIQSFHTFLFGCEHYYRMLALTDLAAADYQDAVWAVNRLVQ